MTQLLPTHLQVSTNRHFLVDGQGRPFFWLGDTAWELFHRLTREETELYLDNRRRKGFNLVQAVALAEFEGLTVPNAYGELPLHQQDPRQPNEAYFAHVDWAIAAAAARGLVVGLLPTWGDKVNKMWGAGPVVFDEASARDYGAWLGRRYRQAPNILWIMGGDRPELDNAGHDYSGVVRAMAEGIRAGVAGPVLMSYHPAGGRGSAQAFHQEAWLDINMWQSGHHQQDMPNWELIGTDYGREPVKPVLDGEPCYEDHPINPWPHWTPAQGYFRDHDVRKALYRSVLAGACGVTYGHHSIWQFYDPAQRLPVNHPWCDWRTALDRPAASQVGYLRRLVESRPYLTRVPDQTLLPDGPGEGASYAVAARDSQGRSLMVYLPAARPLQVRLDDLTGAVLRAWWFDPRSGQAELIGEFAPVSRRIFTPPAGGPDWVLVVDDAAAALAAPGAALA